MPREFASQKALRNHAELTGYVHLWEGTRAFTTRQRLLSADQYEIVDVRTDRGMTRAMLFPKAILKAEWDAAAPLRDGLTIKARAMAAIAVGEREEWAAPRRVKPVNRERAPAFSAALTPRGALPERIETQGLALEEPLFAAWNVMQRTEAPWSSGPNRANNVPKPRRL
jgi:hypothetical protein